MLYLLALLILAIFFGAKKSNRKWLVAKNPFPSKWRVILAEKVNFYNALDKLDKESFEVAVQEFILNHKINGVEVEVDITDKLLVAASAIIPVFQFPNWHYTNLEEVLLYPDMFNEKFETNGSGRSILGMVGTGYMDGKMILSKKALHHGFSNMSDRKNTAIHEFVHLIDKMDGVMDGMPSLLLENQYAIPWFDLLRHKIEEIYKNKSEINPYGGTNKVEFFAVISEYFFERPKMLSANHPVLYEMLEEIFNKDMASMNLNKKRTNIRRNSPCPCNSGKKFKHCCR